MILYFIDGQTFTQKKLASPPEAQKPSLLWLGYFVCLGPNVMPGSDRASHSPSALHRRWAYIASA